MWYLVAIILVALAIGIFALGAIRARNVNRQDNNKRGAGALTLGLVLAIVLGLLAVWAWPNNNASADGDAKVSKTQQAHFSGSNCEKSPKVAEEANYGINNPQTNVFAATGGNLIGNGPPLDSSSASASVKDLYNRTESNPKLTANLAYVMRLSGFTPKDETRDQVKVDVAFLDARVASLVNDHKLWSQTRRNICAKLGDSSMDADPYKDRDLTEITTRVAQVEAEGIILPVTNVVLGRTTQPDGVRLLWINRDVDTTGERPNMFPIAVDVQYAWPVIVGEIPESAEKPAPKSEQQAQQDQQFQQQQEQQSQQRQGNDQSGGGSGKTSGKGGGNNSNQHNGDQNGCNGTCGSGNTQAGNGQGPGNGGGPGGGGNCSGSCGGVTPTTPSGGCGTCGTPTTSKPPPPTSPPTTRPPTTMPPPTSPPTTRPPTTVPPTVPPTTAPPRTTTTLKPPPQSTTTVFTCPPATPGCG